MIENRKRKIQIKFRVDEKERECIMKKVQLSRKKSMANYLRFMAITGKIINVELEDIKILSANIGRISSNINQLVKCANATGNVYDEDIAELKRMETEIWKELKSIRLALRSLQTY